MIRNCRRWKLAWGALISSAFIGAELAFGAVPAMSERPDGAVANGATNGYVSVLSARRARGAIRSVAARPANGYVDQRQGRVVQASVPNANPAPVPEPVANDVSSSSELAADVKKQDGINESVLVFSIVDTQPKYGESIELEARREEPKANPDARVARGADRRGYGVDPAIIEAHLDVVRRGGSSAESESSLRIDSSTDASALSKGSSELKLGSEPTRSQSAPRFSANTNMAPGWAVLDDEAQISDAVANEAANREPESSLDLSPAASEEPATDVSTTVELNFASNDEQTPEAESSNDSVPESRSTLESALIPDESDAEIDAVPILSDPESVESTSEDALEKDALKQDSEPDSEEIQSDSVLASLYEVVPPEPATVNNDLASVQSDPASEAPSEAPLPEQFIWSDASESAPAAQMIAAAARSLFSRSCGADAAPNGCRADSSLTFSGVIADVDWLGWKTDGSNRAFARTMTTDGSTSDSKIEPSGSGVRGRLGYRALAGWDIVGGFTYFFADKNCDVAAPTDGGYLFNPQSRYFSSTDSLSANAETKLDICDIELGRWNQREGWAFRPFIGARWTSLDESLNEKCDYMTEEAKAVADKVVATSKTDAIGVRFGGEFKTDSYYGLSAFGRGAGTIASGNVKARSVETIDDGLVGASYMKKSRAVPALDGALGVAWKRGAFEIKGGYEFNVWYDASQLGGKKSNFCAYGCFAGASWNR